MYILLSSTEQVYRADVRLSQAIDGGSQVSASFSMATRPKLAERGAEQLGYLQKAAEAAHVSLNPLDYAHPFKAQLNLTPRQGEAIVLEAGSNSAGLGYALSLHMAFRRKLNKVLPTSLPVVFATGKVESSGEVHKIGHLPTKLAGAFDCAQNQHAGEPFVVYYPQANASEVNDTHHAQAQQLGGRLVAVSRLGEALLDLLGEHYDGDLEARLEPFKGLLSFNYEDSLRFFGRERALTKLNQEFNEAEGLLVVTGVSGSGKSSLIKAGLIPKIHQKMPPGTSLDWFISTPKAHGNVESIVYELFITLDKHWSILNSTADEQKAEMKALVNAAIQSPESLIDTIKNAQLSHPSKSIFYYIDQFEDIFNHQDISREQAKQLAPLLAQLAKKIPHLYIVISIRSEYENILGKYGSVVHVNSELKASEWRDIVYKQAATFGLSYEEGLEKRIVNEAANIQHALPALEYLLEQLYNKAKKADKNTRILTHEHYEQLKGIKGVIAARAEEVIAKHPMQAYAFFEHFVGLNNEDKPYAKSVNIEEVQKENAALYSLIQAFIEAQLVVDCSTNIEKRVKLAHDTLFNIENDDIAWSTLKEWFEESQAYLQWFNAITGDFWRWCALNTNKENLNANNKKHPSRAFLLNEYDLSTGLKFQQANCIQQPKVREYIAQSQKQKEALLQERNKKQRLVILLVSVLLLIAVGSGLVAYQKELEATKQKSVALKQKSIAEKQTQLALDEKKRAEDLFSEAEEQRKQKEDAEAKAAWLGEDRRKFRDILKTVSQIFPTKRENLSFIKGKIGEEHIEAILTNSIDIFSLEIFQMFSTIIISRQAFVDGPAARLFEPASLAQVQKFTYSFLKKYKGKGELHKEKRKELVLVMINAIKISEPEKQQYREALKKLDNKGLSNLYDELSSWIFAMENKEIIENVKNISLAISLIEIGEKNISEKMILQLNDKQIDYVMPKLNHLDGVSESVLLNLVAYYTANRQCIPYGVTYSIKEKIVNGTLKEESFKYLLKLMQGNVDSNEAKECDFNRIKSIFEAKINEAITQTDYNLAVFYNSKYIDLLLHISSLGTNALDSDQFYLYNAYNNQASAYRGLNNFTSALEFQLAALHIAESHPLYYPNNSKFNVRASSVKLNIAELYFLLNKPNEVIKILLSAVKGYEGLEEGYKSKKKYRFLRTSIYEQLGTAYLLLNQLEKSKDAFANIFVDAPQKLKDSLFVRLQKVIVDDSLTIKDKRRNISTVIDEVYYEYESNKYRSVENDIELIQLIKGSSSMNQEEKEYWVDLLPIMTIEQVNKLYDTLKNEEEVLQVLEKVYDAERLLQYGELRAASDIYLHITKIYDANLRRSPLDSKRRKRLTSSLNKLSKIYMQVGLVDKSNIAYQDSLSVCERYQLKEPGELARCYYDLTTARWETNKGAILARYSKKYGGALISDQETWKKLYLNGSWYLLHSDNPVSVINIIEKKLSEFSHGNQIFLSTNLSHAYLLSGKYDKAKAIYLKYKGKTMNDGQLWDEVIISDFKALEKGGVVHPDFARITREVFSP